MKYIEAGWESFRKAVVPAEASEEQVSDLRDAFYGGAAILFQTIINMLDPGDEPTDTDLAKMSELQTELDVFGADLDRRAGVVGRPS